MDVNYTSAVIISLIQGTIIQYVIDNEAFDYREITQKKLMKQINLIHSHRRKIRYYT